MPADRMGPDLYSTTPNGKGRHDALSRRVHSYCNIMASLWHTSTPEDARHARRVVSLSIYRMPSFELTALAAKIPRKSPANIATRVSLFTQTRCMRNNATAATIMYCPHIVPPMCTARAKITLHHSANRPHSLLPGLSLATGGSAAAAPAATGASIPRLVRRPRPL